MTSTENAKKTALVTGANRGLGREVARQLAARGFRVIAASRGGDADPGALDLPIEFCALDVTDPASIGALAKSLQDQGRSIALLVNNAGVMFKEFDAEIAARTLAVNFFGAMAVTDALLSRIPDGGAVVMVSSGLGELSAASPALRERLLAKDLSRDTLVSWMRAFPEEVAKGTHEARGWPSSAYRVSKIGLNALTRILARDLAPRRIRVNAVCPGWVRTDMGGPQAHRSVEQGATSIVAAALFEERVTGTFSRDGQELAW